MSARTAIYAVVAAASLFMAGVQAIGGDLHQPEANAIGLGEQCIASTLQSTHDERGTGVRASTQLTASR